MMIVSGDEVAIRMEVFGMDWGHPLSVLGTAARSNGLHNSLASYYML